MKSFKTPKSTVFIRFVVVYSVLISFVLNPTLGWSQSLNPGLSVPLASNKFNSNSSQQLMLMGLKIHQDNPFQLDFIVNSQTRSVVDNAKQLELIKQFLTMLTLPREDMWVNLSPYESGRIMPSTLSKTATGRLMLDQDYHLKSAVASLSHPNTELGKYFWKTVYQKLAEQGLDTNIPINLINKVWITPDEATLYQKSSGVFIVESRLKVMLEKDYLAMRKNVVKDTVAMGSESVLNKSQEISTQVLKDIILPVIEKEINEGESFSQVRQLYQGFILATWFKQTIREHILNEMYSDKVKLSGLSQEQHKQIDRIFKRYLRAFKQGAYQLIEEKENPLNHQMQVRKYFSGGLNLTEDFPMKDVGSLPQKAMISSYQGLTVQLINPAMLGQGDLRNDAQQALILLEAGDEEGAFNLIKPSLMKGTNDVEITDDELLRRAIKEFQSTMSQDPNQRLLFDLARLFLLKKRYPRNYELDKRNNPITEIENLIEARNNDKSTAENKEKELNQQLNGLNSTENVDEKIKILERNIASLENKLKDFKVNSPSHMAYLVQIRAKKSELERLRLENSQKQVSLKQALEENIKQARDEIATIDSHIKELQKTLDERKKDNQEKFRVRQEKIQESIDGTLTKIKNQIATPIGVEVEPVRSQVDLNNGPEVSVSEEAAVEENKFQDLSLDELKDLVNKGSLEKWSDLVKVLKRIRKLKDLTQRDITVLNQKTLSDWERGDAKPSNSNSLKIWFEALGLESEAYQKAYQLVEKSRDDESGNENVEVPIGKEVNSDSQFLEKILTSIKNKTFTTWPEMVAGLKSIRELKKLKLRQIVDDVSSLSRWENVHSLPEDSGLEKWFSALGILETESIEYAKTLIFKLRQEGYVSRAKRKKAISEDNNLDAEIQGEVGAISKETHLEAIEPSLDVLPDPTTSENVSVSDSVAENALIEAEIENRNLEQLRDEDVPKSDSSSEISHRAVEEIQKEESVVPTQTRLESEEIKIWEDKIKNAKNREELKKVLYSLVKGKFDSFASFSERYSIGSRSYYSVAFLKIMKPEPLIEALNKVFGINADVLAEAFIRTHEKKSPTNAKIKVLVPNKEDDDGEISETTFSNLLISYSFSSTLSELEKNFSELEEIEISKIQEMLQFLGINEQSFPKYLDLIDVSGYRDLLKLIKRNLNISDDELVAKWIVSRDILPNFKKLYLESLGGSEAIKKLIPYNLEELREVLRKIPEDEGEPFDALVNEIKKLTDVKSTILIEQHLYSYNIVRNNMNTMFKVVHLKKEELERFLYELLNERENLKESAENIKSKLIERVYDWFIPNKQLNRFIKVFEVFSKNQIKIRIEELFPDFETFLDQFKFDKILSEAMVLTLLSNIDEEQDNALWRELSNQLSKMLGIKRTEDVNKKLNEMGFFKNNMASKKRSIVDTFYVQTEGGSKRIPHGELIKELRGFIKEGLKELDLEPKLLGFYDSLANDKIFNAELTDLRKNNSEEQLLAQFKDSDASTNKAGEGQHNRETNDKKRRLPYAIAYVTLHNYVARQLMSKLDNYNSGIVQKDEQKREQDILGDMHPKLIEYLEKVYEYFDGDADLLKILYTQPKKGIAIYAINKQKGYKGKKDEAVFDYLTQYKIMISGQSYRASQLPGVLKLTPAQVKAFAESKGLKIDFDRASIVPTGGIDFNEDFLRLNTLGDKVILSAKTSLSAIKQCPGLMPLIIGRIQIPNIEAYLL